MTRQKNRFVNAKGEIIYTDSDIVPDGCGITTSMMLMDGLDDTQREIARSFSRPARVCDAIGRTAGHRPGFLLMDKSNSKLRDSDATEGTRAVRKRQIADAWRQPMTDGNAALRAVERQAADTGQAELARDSAFAELEKRSANAWRGGR